MELSTRGYDPVFFDFIRTVSSCFVLVFISEFSVSKTRATLLQMASVLDEPAVETWDTLKGLISDLELLLTADADELKSLDELRRVRQDMRTIVTGREADARRVIQGVWVEEACTFADSLRNRNLHFER
jgi:hypothetical protein